jgi:hypothetical protein
LKRGVYLTEHLIVIFRLHDGFPVPTTPVFLQEVCHETRDLSSRRHPHPLHLAAFAGYERSSLDQWIRLKDHGVSPAFVRELKEIGYSNVPLDQLVRLKDHGVNASYIRRMKEKGYGDRTLDEYIRMKDRGERDE